GRGLRLARRARPRAPARAALLFRARRRGGGRRPAGRPPSQSNPAPLPRRARQRAPGATAPCPRDASGQQPPDHGRPREWLLAERPRVAHGGGHDRGERRLHRGRARRRALFLTLVDARTQDGGMRRDVGPGARARWGQRGFGLVEILVVAVILAVIGTFLYQY